MIEIVDHLTVEDMAILRATSIGGSDAPPIMRASPFATPLELWARKKRLIPPQAVTHRMLRGLRLEPIARAKYEAETGIPMPAKVVKHAEIRYRHASLDGRNGDARGAIEIKAPGEVDHIEALNGNVPRKYIWQCVHNLSADPDLDWIDYYSFNPDFDGPETARIRVMRDARLERELAASEAEFYRFMTTNAPPPPGPKELPWPWPKFLLNQKREETMGMNQTHSERVIRELTEVLDRAKWLASQLAGTPGAQTFNGPMNPPPPGEPRPVCPVHGTAMNRSKYDNGPKHYCFDCNRAKKGQAH